MDRDAIWAITAVAKPSSSPGSVPSLDSAYWKRVFPAPLTKRSRICDQEDTPELGLLVGSPSTLALTSYIGRGGTCAAFRGTWHGVPIVAKYIQSKYSTPFVGEANAYLGGLARLRGTIVPEFFGLYRSNFFALLVVEDCGDRISKWDDLDLEERCVLVIFIHAIESSLTRRQAGLVLHRISSPHVWPLPRRR
jgi:hypothetical protein